MSRRALALGLLLVAGNHSVEAQTVAPGSNIRFWSAEPGGRTTMALGTVVGQQGDVLLIQRRHTQWAGFGKMGAASSDTTRLALSSVRRLDVWQGRSHLRGAFKGFLIGIGSGLVAGGAVAWAGRNEPESMSVLAIPALGVTGATVGTLAGVVIGSARWQRLRP